MGKSDQAMADGGKKWASVDWGGNSGAAVAKKEKAKKESKEEEYRTFHEYCDV